MEQYNRYNESLEKLIPVGNRWLAVFFKDDLTDKTKEDKVLFISPNGEGYITDDVELAYNKEVPKEVYLKNAGDFLDGFNYLEEKHFDEENRDFLIEYLNKISNKMSECTYTLLRMLKIKNRELLTRLKDATIEEVFNILYAELEKGPQVEDFEDYNRVAHFLVIHGVSDLIKLRALYCSGKGQQKEGIS